VDWKTTQPGSLNVDIYQNDEDLLEGEGAEAIKRIAKPIDSTLLGHIAYIRICASVSFAMRHEHWTILLNEQSQKSSNTTHFPSSHDSR
jgi:hypothetical protein